MSLIEKIKSIYPVLTDADFEPLGTIHLQNDSNGQGDYIKIWNNSNPEPTQIQLNAIIG